MQNQMYAFIIFILDGLLIGIIFDIFRILRKSFKTADFITYIEDICFWLISGFIILYSILIFNNGELRMFILIGLFIGISIYLLLFSKTFISVSICIINIFKKIFEILIIIPIKFIKKIAIKIFYEPLKKLFNNIRKICKKNILNLKKIPKKTDNTRKTKNKKDFA